MRGPSTRSLAAIALGSLLASAAGVPARIGAPAPFAVELALLIVGGVLALRSAHVLLGADASSRPALRVAAVLLAAIAVGQIARSKQAFPLMPYTMYGRAAEGDIAYYEYQARHRSGARSRLSPSTVFATLGSARIVKGLARKLDAIASQQGQGLQPTGELILLRETLSALAARYSRAHPADPLTHVDVVRVVLPPPYAQTGARRRLVMTLAVGPAP